MRALGITRQTRGNFQLRVSVQSACEQAHIRLSATWGACWQDIFLAYHTQASHPLL